jgi:hypothetical protein
MVPELTTAALDAIAFLTGATLSAMLGQMQWRVDRAAGDLSGYLLLWVVGFIWTFGNFLRCALNLGGVTADAGIVKFAETFAWSCTLLGPVVIGRLLQGGLGTANRAGKVVFALMVGVSVVNLVLMARANHQYDWRLEASGYPTTSFYMALAVTLIALVVYQVNRAHAPPRRNMPRWFPLAAVLFAIIHTASILLSMLPTKLSEPVLLVLSLIGRHWTIPWAILIAVSLAQAHYADVIAKRSLWLLACVAIATLVAIAVIGAAPGLPLLLSALTIAALMLVSPRLIRALDSLVDEAILARPDFAAAGRELAERLRRATRREELVDIALTAVRSTLHVDASFSDRLEVSSPHQGRTLMQAELAFLDSARTQLQHRLDSLRLEDEQRALLLREERLRRLLTEAELKALRTQVDPHFLFNTLNTIVELIGSKPDQAERMTERLAECFRYALAMHSRDSSTLDDELRFARHYLEIEQERFGDRLRVDISQQGATGTESVPSLLLQPLLENAIRHGLAPLREGGCVTVRAQRDGDRLRIIVENDGVGLPATRRTGIGLSNVQERLRTLYGAASEFSIAARSEGRGTCVTLVIPLNAH